MWSCFNCVFTVFLILLPLFIISGFLSFYLAREIDKDNKKKEKKGKTNDTHQYNYIKLSYNYHIFVSFCRE